MAIIKEDNGLISGGAEKWYIKPFALGASVAPSWTNTPVKPNKVYLTVTGSSTHFGTVITNVNQQTGQIDGTTYETTDGTTWSTSSYSFIITDTSVALSSQVSSVAQGGAFFITE